LALVLASNFFVGQIMHAVGLVVSLGVIAWRLLGTIASMIPTLVAAR
jgi:hypothetical protein